MKFSLNKLNPFRTRYRVIKKDGLFYAEVSRISYLFVWERIDYSHHTNIEEAKVVIKNDIEKNRNKKNIVVYKE